MTREAPRRSRAAALARGWRGFRRWRRGRPFWGGFFLLLSALWLLGTSNQDLTNLQVHIGVTGFLSYLIPTVLALCGLLAWFSPQQRMFYGVIGVLTAVYSAIGLNLGGFIVGMLLGMVGGALVASWTPVEPTPPTPNVERRATDDLGAGPSDEADPAEQYDGTVTVEQLFIGPLTDIPPETNTSPLYGRQQAPRHALPERDHDPQRPPDQTVPEEVATDEGPPPLPRRSPRITALTIIVLTLGAVAITVLRTGAPAEAAATCASVATVLKVSPSRAPAPSSRPPAAAQPGLIGSAPHTSGAAPATGSAAAASAESASPSPSPSDSATPSQSPSPSVSPAPSPSGSPPAPPPSSPAPSRSAAPSPSATAPPSTAPATPVCPTAKALVAPAGQPIVTSEPAILTTALLGLTGLSFDGVIDLPTATGTIRCLQFSMDTSTLTPFEEDDPFGTTTKVLTGGQLSISGNVQLYATEIKGNLLGVLPVDFTPVSPPPIVVRDLFFTDATVRLVYVRSDQITASGISISFRG